VIWLGNRNMPRREYNLPLITSFPASAIPIARMLATQPVTREAQEVILAD
jgi:hypothetical protein